MTTGKAGLVSQAVGLAQAIGIPFTIKTVHLHAPWSWLPGDWAARLGLLGSLDPADGITPPWPDLLISCGGRSGAVAIAIKRASRGRSFTVCIQDPRVPAAYFDMVVPPEHDGLHGRNVYPSRGALHKLTREALAEAAQRFQESFSAIHKPFVAVLIGGKSRAYDLTPRHMRELASQLKTLARNQGAGLVITTSRRTGAENEAILREALSDTDAWIWDGKGDNPYLAMMALADYIIVTEDSVSMVSEACYTGKPVYVASLGGGSRRFRQFHRSMQASGFTRPFTGQLETWSYEPLDENRRIAGIVREKLTSHMSTYR
jgi:uncharacterized protein